MVLDFLRRLLELHSELVDRVETELAAQRTSRPRRSA
jgi:hypothetical protein